MVYGNRRVLPDLGGRGLLAVAVLCRSGYGINHEAFPPTKCIEISSIFVYILISDISAFVQASPFILKNNDKIEITVKNIATIVTQITYFKLPIYRNYMNIEYITIYSILNVNILNK